MVYLNLDLLENVNKFWFPLFYYGFIDCSESKEIFCSRTIKSIHFHKDGRKTYKIDGFSRKYIKRKYKENNIYLGNILKACKIQPFKINKEDLNFLKGPKSLKPILNKN